MKQNQHYYLILVPQRISACLGGKKKKALSTDLKHPIRCNVRNSPGGGSMGIENDRAAAEFCKFSWLLIRVKLYT